MCDNCKTDICKIFDRLIEDYFREFPEPTLEDKLRRGESSERLRPKYIQMDVANAPKSAVDANTFANMVKASSGIGYVQPQDFVNELARRSGFGDLVKAWAYQGKIPNGLARKMILTNAEDMIREGGGAPKLSLQNIAEPVSA